MNAYLRSIWHAHAMALSLTEIKLLLFLLFFCFSHCVGVFHFKFLSRRLTTFFMLKSTNHEIYPAHNAKKTLTVVGNLIYINTPYRITSLFFIIFVL